MPSTAAAATPPQTDDGDQSADTQYSARKAATVNSYAAHISQDIGI